MNQRRLSPTDLQSVAFDHSAILPPELRRKRRTGKILPYIALLSRREKACCGKNFPITIRQMLEHMTAGLYVKTGFRHFLTFLFRKAQKRKTANIKKHAVCYNWQQKVRRAQAFAQNVPVMRALQ